MARMHESFEQIRAVIVERKDRPGLLGVFRSGARFVCALPEGYDGRVSLVVHNGYVLVGHPELPPLRCDPERGTVELIDPHHIDASIPGRMKLLTH